MTHALLFPGQGAQAIGMGKDLADSFPEARAVFQEVDEALGQNLSAMIWDGDIETLTLTENAQPALMATSVAAARALTAAGVDLTKASFVAGHSLGEYSALCAAGAISLSDTARLLRIRGKAMQAAVPVGVGAMAAILGLDFEAVSKIANEAAGAEVCQAANDNDPGQVVVSDAQEIKGLLVEQVTGSVRWRETVAFMSAQGVTETFEIGAGKALSGMVRRVDRAIGVNAVGDAAGVAAAAEKLG